MSRLALLCIITVLFSMQGPISAAWVVEGYFKPSVASNLPYRWQYCVWDDYCPACHHHNCLLLNPKGVPEGELTCRYCGADYCGVTGLSKEGGRWRLRKPGKSIVDLTMLMGSIDRSLSVGARFAGRETMQS